MNMISQWQPSNFSDEALYRCVLNAISRGRLGVIQFLITHYPWILETAKTNPLPILEAAAVYTDSSMFNAMTELGIELFPNSNYRGGSVLTVAILAPNEALVQTLLTSLSNSELSNETRKAGLEFPRNRCDGFSEHDKSIFREDHFAGMYALNAAIGCHNERTVEALLQRSFDANERDEFGVAPLQAAAWAGNACIVKMLLENDADPNFIPSESGEKLFFPENGLRLREWTYLTPTKEWLNQTLTPLEIALECGHWETANLIASYSSDTSTLPKPVPCHTNPFHKAIREKLLKRFLPESPEFKDCTPWCKFFSEASMDDIVQLQAHGVFNDSILRSHLSFSVMYHGVDSIAPSFRHLLLEDGMVPLGFLVAAVYHGDHNFVKAAFELLRLRDHLSISYSRYGSTALIIAVLQEDLVMIDLLLDFGVNPHQPHGMPCYIEPSMGHFDLSFFQLYWFLDTPSQVAVYMIAFVGQAETALHLSILRKFLDWRYPIRNHDQGCQIRYPAALFLLARLRNRTAVITLLQQQGIDDQIFKTELLGTIPKLHLDVALHYHLIQGYEETLFEWLIQLGAGVNPSDVNLFDKFNTWRSPLQLATERGDLVLVKRLIELGADVNAQPAREYGATALQFAAIHGDFELVDLLLDAGADINAPRGHKEGRTAIEGAAEWGRLDMTSYLLKRGAHVASKDNRDYRRAIYRACDQGHHAVSSLIQDWKWVHYGDADREATEVICSEMTEDELTSSTTSPIQPDRSFL